MTDRLTRTTTTYEGRANGWRKLNVNERELETEPFGHFPGVLVPKSNHQCGPQCVRRRNRKKAS
jgi:hypothetical protein